MENSISVEDLRNNMRILEQAVKELLDQKIRLIAKSREGIYMNGVEVLIKTKVVDKANKDKPDAMQFLKFTIQDGKPVTLTEVQVTGGGRSQTRKEPITLLKFHRDEKLEQLFLKYPIGLKNWKGQRMDYELKLRSNMLMSHLDNEAQKKNIGLENKYKEAMNKLDKYYGDTKKVILACIAEKKVQAQVQSHDYKGLLSLKTCLENNFAQLKSQSLEHEIFNTYSMELILKKFPISTGKYQME